MPRAKAQTAPDPARSSSLKDMAAPPPSVSSSSQKIRSNEEALLIAAARAAETEGMEQRGVKRKAVAGGAGISPGFTQHLQELGGPDPDTPMADIFHGTGGISSSPPMFGGRQSSRRRISTPVSSSPPRH